MKCGPDGCPIIAFSDLTVDEQRVQRKRIAEKMYGQGFTMMQIATQLGVKSVSTIHHDLRDFSEIEKLKQAKTETNPKGAGRPRKSKRDREKLDHTIETARRMKAEGRPVTRGTLMTEASVGDNTAQITVNLLAHEEGLLKEIEEKKSLETARDALSEKGKIKLDHAIRIHIARLNKQFEQAVNAEVRRRIDAADDAMRKHNKELRKENLQLEAMLSKRAPLTKVQYRQMQILCHPDGSASERTKADLLQWLVEHERRLTGS
jgi:hypothetical protein